MRCKNDEYSFGAGTAANNGYLPLECFCRQYKLESKGSRP